MADLYFFRDSKGNEIDVLAQSGRKLHAIEIKSASTFSMEQLKGLYRFKEITDRVHSTHLVYAGTPHSLSDGTQAIGYKQVASML